MRTVSFPLTGVVQTLTIPPGNPALAAVFTNISPYSLQLGVGGDQMWLSPGVQDILELDRTAAGQQIQVTPTQLLVSGVIPTPELLVTVYEEGDPIPKGFPIAVVLPLAAITAGNDVTDRVGRLLGTLAAISATPTGNRFTPAASTPTVIAAANPSRKQLTAYMNAGAPPTTLYADGTGTNPILQLQAKDYYELPCWPSIYRGAIAMQAFGAPGDLFVVEYS